MTNNGEGVNEDIEKGEIIKRHLIKEERNNRENLKIRPPKKDNDNFIKKRTPDQDLDGSTRRY